MICVFVSADEAHASMRAWRLDPLPEIKTARLYLGSDILSYRIESIEDPSRGKSSCLQLLSLSKQGDRLEWSSKNPRGAKVKVL